MHLEYFQLIDRITDLNIGEKTITVEAQVPEKNTIFEGHFPGYPLMPGVLLIEAMAQTSGWLLIALMKFERMPFLGAVKEAKMRGFVSPGEMLKIDASIVHEGQRRRRTEVQRYDHVPSRPLPKSRSARTHGRHGQAHRVSARTDRP